jgi:hypothetical protein
MSVFLRERRDGRLAPGYAVYLLAGLLGFGAVVVLHRRFATAAGPANGLRPRLSHVAPITQSAATMSRIEVKNPPARPETRSFRLEQPASPSRAPAIPAAESFDAIGVALEQVPAVEPDVAAKAPARPLDESGAGRQRESPSAYPALPPAFSDASTAPAEPRLGYRDPLAGGAPERANDAVKARSRLIPRGTLICAYLLTTVDTSNPSAVLQFAAARSLIFDHRRQIPFGTRFLGRLSGPPMRDRLNLAVSAILYPDGLELPISAAAVEADDGGGNIRPGLGALYVAPPAWVQVAPYLSDVVTGYLGLLEARAQPQLSVGLGGLSVQSGPAAAEPRAAAYQASAQALQEFTQARLKELEQRYASCYLVPAGTACWLQLEADLDLAGGELEISRQNRRR